MIANRIVLSSDHAAIELRQAIAAHIAAQGWVVVDIGPVTHKSTRKQPRETSLQVIAGLA